MQNCNLILSVPLGTVVATRLGIDGYAWHRSPGSGKYFQGRSILIDLALTGDYRPSFKYHDEGGWRDTESDTISALSAISEGKRTKTALSNNGFSCTPISAHKRMFLTKTGGEMLEMDRVESLVKFDKSACSDGMTPNQIAQAAGCPTQATRVPRLYMVLNPVEFIVLSNLTPEEYVWYSTHRPGKIFRQVLFTEIHKDHALNLAAESVYRQAYDEVQHNSSKKTKTIVTGDCFNRVPFQSWVGYRREANGGIYAGDQSGVMLWRFPSEIPRNWERAER